VKTVDAEQGTQEWLDARAGKVTASRINEVLAKIKVGEAVSRRDYRCQIVAEILTGRPQEGGYINDEMRWGTEQEPYARSAYEVSRGGMIKTVGFVLHPTIERAGASPDGVVADDGLVEIKCPKTATHLDYLLTGSVPMKYAPQMAWQMACAERKWCDFVSYDPRLPEEHQLFVVRYHRDETVIAMMEREVEKFLGEVDAVLKVLKDRK
jgi:putative phage-type endonuclease